MRTKRTTKIAIAGGAAATMIGVLASPAGAAVSPPAGLYWGNQCQSSRWYVDNAGAEACVWLNGFTRNSSIRIAGGAYDYAKDGFSAENVTTVQQLISGIWYDTGTTRVVVSSGIGYSRVGSTLSVGRRTNATYVRIRIQACTYDSPTARRMSCGSRIVASASWATGA